MIFKNNRTYDTLRIVQSLCVPFIVAVLIFTSQYWGWEIGLTISGFIEGLNVLFGKFLQDCKTAYANYTPESVEIADDENVFTEHEDKGVM